jgi:hypothetical protein
MARTYDKFSVDEQRKISFGAAAFFGQPLTKMRSTKANLPENSCAA